MIVGSRGEQLASSFDAGDRYVTLRGGRKLHRLRDAVAMLVAENANTKTTQARLTKANGVLDGYRLYVQPAKNVMLLRTHVGEGLDDRPREIAATRQALDRILAAVAREAEVKAANPVFIDPDSGLWLVVTEEIIIRLNPAVDPKVYFGREWRRARQLRGTADRFALKLPDATADEVFLEVARRMADRRVKWAEPNFLGQVIEHYIPNDTYYSSQWHLNNTGQGGGTSDADVDAPEAWNTTTGSADVIVAVIDDGTQTNHPDLSGNFPSNPNETMDSVDNDGNGYTDDRNGWDFYADDNDPSPGDADDNHGTATAGVAAAVGDNSAGVAGMAYGCRLMPLRTRYVSDIPDAVYYAAGRTRDGTGTWRGADIISMSLSFSWTQDTEDALAWAAANGRGGKGCPIFVATGNDASAYASYSVTSLPAGTWFFEWTYSKNGTVDAGDDTCWIAYVQFPNGSVERFDSSGTPTGWDLSPYGSTSWTIENDPAHAHGTGRYQARAGEVDHSESTDIRSKWVTTTATADVSFKYWVSSEAGGDGLTFWLYKSGTGWYGPFLSTSGVPSVTTAIAYPASHTNTIAVGASTNFDYRSDYSQYGTGLDLVSPSGGGSLGIYTTDRTGTDGYDSGSDYDASFSGTSSACPLAAGIGALILAKNGNLTASQVRTVLRRSCEKKGGGGISYSGGESGCGGWNTYYGYGRVNAYEALEDTCSISTPNTPSGTTSGITNTSYSYSTGGSTCSEGHAVEYRFDWGDTTTSSWGSATQSKSWSSADTYSVKAQARCATNQHESAWSSALSVTIAAPTLGISVSPSSWDPGQHAGGNVCLSTSGTRFSVQNTGNISETFKLRISDEDNYDEWTHSSSESGASNNRFVLSGLFCASGNSPVAGSFNEGSSDDVVTTSAQAATSSKFAYAAGSDNGVGVPASSSVYLWFRLDVPTTVSGAHAADDHSITVEVSCQAE